MTTHLFDLKGKVAVVTGASRGIGEAIAVALAGAGAQVVLASRKMEGLEAVAEKIRAEGGEAIAQACHTGRPADVQGLVERAREAFGGVDILVNNAATSPHFGPLLEAEDSHWDKTFEVNVKGYAEAIRSCVPLMRERGGGSIVNLASVAGMFPHGGLGVYGVSKAAVIMMTKTLAVELAGDQVTANCVCPVGCPTTGMGQDVLDWKTSHTRSSADEIVATTARMNPLGRNATEADVADAVMFLLSEQASFLTGVSLDVDGGAHLGVMPGAD